MRGILFLMMTVSFLSSANVVNNHKWYEMPVPEEFSSSITTSPGGRVAYYSRGAGNVLSLWTGMLNTQNPAQTRWLMAAKEGTGGLVGKLVDTYNRLECRDDECLFVTTQGASAIVWKVSGLASGVPQLTKVLAPGQATNLGPPINTLQTFMLDGAKLYVYADVGSSGAGIYELTPQGTLAAAFLQSATQAFAWNPNKMFVRDRVFIFVGKMNYRANNNVLAGDGTFRVDLRNPVRVEEIVGTNLPRTNGVLVLSCCDLAANPAGFLVRYQSHELPDPGDRNKSGVSFVDKLGQTRLVVKADDYRLPEATTYGVTLTERGGVSWGELSYSRNTMVDPVNRTIRQTLFSWKPTGESVAVAQTGDRVYSSGVGWVDRFFYSATTTDNRRVVVTFNAFSTPAVRFAVGIQPSVSSISPVSARPGDGIAVRGSNLFLDGMTTGVRMGGFNIPPTQTSDGLAFVVPASIPSGRQSVVVELTDSTGAITLNAGEVEVANTYPLPSFTMAGIVSAATFQDGPVTASQIVSLFGNNLTSLPPAGAVSIPLPLSLANTRVLVDGQAAPLFHVSTGQINFQLPHTAVAGRNILIQVETRAVDGTLLVSQAASVPVAITAPGCFAANGRPIITKNYILVSASNPAAAGDVVSLWCTGLGPTSPVVPAGQAAPSDPLAVTVLPVAVTVGGIPAQVAFSGLSPGLVGLYQVNFTVPEVGSGEAQSRLEVGGRTTPFSISLQ